MALESASKITDLPWEAEWEGCLERGKDEMWEGIDEMGEIP